MTKIRLPYIHEYADRHGVVRRYMRRAGVPRVALTGLPGSVEFMEAYQAALAALPAPRPSRHGAGSLAALAEDYFKSPEFSNLKPSSKVTYRGVLEPILIKDGQRLVRDLPADKARKIIQEIGHKRPGMANLTRSVLRRLFRFAMRISLRTDNPFDVVPTYKLGTHHTWTETELGAYEARWPLGTRERLTFDLLLYTGQRVGDASQLKRTDISNDQIHLVQDKTGADLRIPIHPALARSLKAGPTLGDNLITDARGNAIQDRAVSKIIINAAKLAGLPRRCLAHGLRKSSMRRLAEYGSTSKQIAAVSGHRSLGEIERYTRQADQVKLARAAIKLLPDKG